MKFLRICFWTLAALILAVTCNPALEIKDDIKRCAQEINPDVIGVESVKVRESEAIVRDWDRVEKFLADVSLNNKHGVTVESYLSKHPSLLVDMKPIAEYIEKEDRRISNTYHIWQKDYWKSQNELNDYIMSTGYSIRRVSYYPVFSDGSLGEYTTYWYFNHTFLRAKKRSPYSESKINQALDALVTTL